MTKFTDEFDATDTHFIIARSRAKNCRTFVRYAIKDLKQALKEGNAAVRELESTERHTEEQVENANKKLRLLQAAIDNLDPLF